jgi:hypothetical protein
VNGQLRAQSSSTREERDSSTRCLGGWMGLRADLDTGEVKNLMPLLV